MPEIITHLEILLTPEGGEPQHLSIPVDAAFVDSLPKNADGHRIYEGPTRLWFVAYPKWESEQEQEEFYKNRKNNQQ